MWEEDTNAKQKARREKTKKRKSGTSDDIAKGEGRGGPTCARLAVASQWIRKERNENVKEGGGKPRDQWVKEFLYRWKTQGEECRKS